MSSLKYIVITPAYNEEQYIAKTLQSMVDQELLPLEWVIVDDNSTDSTSQIVQKYADQFPWIKLVRKTEAEVRQVGAKVVRTFYFGLEQNLIDQL